MRPQNIAVKEIGRIPNDRLRWHFYRPQGQLFMSLGGDILSAVNRDRRTDRGTEVEETAAQRQKKERVKKTDKQSKKRRDSGEIKDSYSRET